MAKRAMSSEKASRIKRSGHANEEHFAAAIGGQVNQGAHTDKKDVIDASHRTHSVKAGTWWQVFLYGRSRLEENTIFQGLGNLAAIMIECIDAYPRDFAAYKQNKMRAKFNLQAPMRKLLGELQNPKLFKAFLNKALFDGGNADYLSVFLGAASARESEKVFHIFHKDDVVSILADGVLLKNSKARNSKQTDDQKVIFWSKMHKKNAGEIEDRHDSKRHYRQMKFRLNAEKVAEMLFAHLRKNPVTPAVITYGKAIAQFKLGKTPPPN